MRCFLKNRKQKTSILISTLFSRGKRNDLKKALSKLWRSKKGMAIPVTFLILFVSLSLVVSITYYFAVSKINSKSQLLKASAAKQSMLYLEDTIASVAWSPSSSQIYSFDNYGGKLRLEPEAKILLINVTDDDSFYDIVFNSSVGDAVYELPPAESFDDNLYMKGDSRVVINQSRSTMSQLYISQGAEYREITLCYRPLASSTETGSSGGKPTNSLRIYVINLNSSQNTTFDGNFHLEITSLNVTSSSRNYNFTSQINSLLVKVDFDGVSSEVSLPVSSNAGGALVTVEIVTSDIRLRSVGV
ncbi:MAG: hypothetical protein JSV12_01580 [Candidatus Bathyarchaeota archaeon]|nr:MAG: hypothetical protein JSV12_01580 [Candidatus Bathyarchaeota archaeon]